MCDSVMWVSSTMTVNVVPNILDIVQDGFVVTIDHPPSPYYRPLMGIDVWSAK